MSGNKKKFIFNIILCAGTAMMLFSVLSFLFVAIPYDGTLDKKKISSSAGNRYVYPLMETSRLLKILLAVPGDSNEFSQRSCLVFKENGKPLGPPHAVHASIEELGKGLYSHWNDVIYFSSSDNTDPMTNGREYSFSGTMYPRLGILILIFLSGFLTLDIVTALKFMEKKRKKEAAEQEKCGSEVQASQATTSLRPRKKKSLIKQLVFMCIAFSFIILAGLGFILLIELGVRVIYPIDKGMLLDAELFKYHPYLAHTHAPGMKLGKSKNIMESLFGHSPKTDSDDGYTCKFNSLGFRSPEFTNLPPKGKNEIRIIITGGSASISWNIGEKGKLEVIVEEILKKEFPDKKFSFFNLGNGAWISIQELFAIQLYGTDIQPDFIIAYDVFNDAQHAVYSDINSPYCGYMKVASQRMEKWAQGRIFDFFEAWKTPGMVRKLFSNQLILNVAPSLVSPDGKYKPTEWPEKASAAKPGYLTTSPMGSPLNLAEVMKRKDFDPYNRKVVDNYLKNISLMACAAGLSGGELIVALQPALIFKTPMSDYEKKITDLYYGGEANFIAMCYERISQDLQKLSKTSKNISMLDLRAPFTGMPQTIFCDNVHVTPDGNRIPAGLLAEFIAKRIKAKESNPVTEK